MARLIVAAVSWLMLCGLATAADYTPMPQRGGPGYAQEAYVDVCHIERCGPTGCRRVNLCRCPDHLSCYGLYDAYGPFGGRSFLSTYTRY
jgi:hypothetical protein